MARYPDDGLDDEDNDRPLDEGGEIDCDDVEREGCPACDGDPDDCEPARPCDGVHDSEAGAHACTVCYPEPRR